MDQVIPGQILLKANNKNDIRNTLVETKLITNFRALLCANVQSVRSPSQQKKIYLLKLKAMHLLIAIAGEVLDGTTSNKNKSNELN